MIQLKSKTAFRPLAAWTVAEAAEIMGALRLERGDYPFGPISTDTRTIRPGDYFLALRGENFDGHRFCDQAVGKGAAGLILDWNCQQDFSSRLPVLRVKDTLRAYGDLARFQREAWGGRVIAISGSVGKTTTRRLIASALSQGLNVLEPEKNFNNLIGVPQTLLKLKSDHEIAVLELGMNMRGELARLTEIAQPSVAGLTRIGLTHVGMFESPEELIEQKFSLFEGCAPGVPLVVNLDCGNSRRALERFSAEHPITTFSVEGKEEADCRAANLKPLKSSVGYRFDLITPGETFARKEVRQFGRQFVENAVCAAAHLVAANLNVEWIAPALKLFRNESYRGQIEEVGSSTFILDCYNAAPDSMRASLRSLAEMPWKNGGTILVLADMLELGTHSRAAHEALLEDIRPLAPAKLFGLGPESSRLAELLWEEGWEAQGFMNGSDLTAALKRALRAGDRVFFKGSHGFALEKIAHELMKGEAAC